MASTDRAEGSGAGVALIDRRIFGGSALTGDGEVPKDHDLGELADDIPTTYVPARTTIFLSFALALAEARDAPNIFIGVSALDYKDYLDCRSEFIAEFEQTANRATKAAVAGRQRYTIQGAASFCR